MKNFHFFIKLWFFIFLNVYTCIHAYANISFQQQTNQGLLLKAYPLLGELLATEKIATICSFLNRLPIGPSFMPSSLPFSNVKFPPFLTIMQAIFLGDKR